MVDQEKSEKRVPKERSLLSAPKTTTRRRPKDSLTSTQDAMDELLDETFNSDSLDDMHSLVGLDETPEPESEDAETAVLAGPTSPDAQAKRYKKLRSERSFWEELERQEEE